MRIRIISSFILDIVGKLLAALYVLFLLTLFGLDYRIVIALVIALILLYVINDRYEIDTE